MEKKDRICSLDCDFEYTYRMNFHAFLFDWNEFSVFLKQQSELYSSIWYEGIFGGNFESVVFDN